MGQAAGPHVHPHQGCVHALQGTGDIQQSGTRGMQRSSGYSGGALWGRSPWDSRANECVSRLTHANTVLNTTATKAAPATAAAKFATREHKWKKHAEKEAKLIHRTQEQGTPHSSCSVSVRGTRGTDAQARAGKRGGGGGVCVCVEGGGRWLGVPGPRMPKTQRRSTRPPRLRRAAPPHRCAALHRPAACQMIAK